MQALMAKTELQKKVKEGKIVRETDENKNINACIFV